MLVVQLAGLRLRHYALSGRDLGRTQMLASQHDGVIQVEQRGALVELELGERERQTATNE